MYEEFDECTRFNNEYDTTTNSSVFNKLYKERHAACSYCSWHQRKFGGHNENDAWDYYYLDTNPNCKWPLSMPNWKLCSKNRKQWMKKPLKLRKVNRRFYKHDHFSIEW